MAKKQFFNIKYPFTNSGSENYFLDLNSDSLGKARSDLMHLVFTPKGQRLRDPNFGTNLIKYIFDQNESLTWSKIESEIKLAVSYYLPYIVLDKIQIAQNEELATEIFVRLDFTVKMGPKTVTDSIITTI